MKVEPLRETDRQTGGDVLEEEGKRRRFTVGMEVNRLQQRREVALAAWPDVMQDKSVKLESYLESAQQKA